MSLKELGEFGFIKKISKDCIIRPENVVKGIGDDAAVFKVPEGELTLVTTDLLVERVHFLSDSVSGENLGHKALAVNLSDIAAMGGTAGEAFISIALPDNIPLDYIENIYRGMKGLAAEYGVNLLGGDTTSSKTDLIINITVTGTAEKDKVLFRHTAKPGDIIFSTGYLGDSRAGLKIILDNIKPESGELEELLSAHLLPKPYLNEGRFLAGRKGVHAAIDVSDGLSSDLGHILEESNAGAILYGDSIPVSENLKFFCSKYNCDTLEFALNGGEDYTLLCTVSPDLVKSVSDDYLKNFNCPLFQIGEITGTPGMKLVTPEGVSQNICPEGWDHLK